MENLNFSWNPGKQKNKWTDDIFHGPSQPKIVTELDEKKMEPLFMHPAEKPAVNNPVYRVKQLDPI